MGLFSNLFGGSKSAPVAPTTWGPWQPIDEWTPACAGRIQLRSKKGEVSISTADIHPREYDSNAVAFRCAQSHAA